MFPEYLRENYGLLSRTESRCQTRTHIHPARPLAFTQGCIQLRARRSATNYIAAAVSPKIAERYTSSIVAYCESLQDFLLRGTRRDDVRPGLRITNYKKRAVIAFSATHKRCFRQPYLTKISKNQINIKNKSLFCRFSAKLMLFLKIRQISCY